jgi:hypothetical protein
MNLNIYIIYSLMDIYKRLPDELQRIVKKYTLCSPHKQLLLSNPRHYTYCSCSGLICFHNNKITNLQEFRRRTVFNCERYIFRKTLLWYYYELDSKDGLILFILQNIPRYERNRLCKLYFNRCFYKLNMTQLMRLRLHIYHTV